MILIIQGPASTMTRNMINNLGMNDKVISLICVAAWKILTNNPVANAERSRGADMMKVISSACLPIVIALSGVIAIILLGIEALCQ